MTQPNSQTNRYAEPEEVSDFVVSAVSLLSESATPGIEKTELDADNQLYVINQFPVPESSYNILGEWDSLHVIALGAPRKWASLVATFSYDTVTARHMRICMLFGNGNASDRPSHLSHAAMGAVFHLGESSATVRNMVSKEASAYAMYIDRQRKDRDEAEGMPEAPSGISIETMAELGKLLLEFSAQ